MQTKVHKVFFFSVIILIILYFLFKQVALIGLIVVLGITIFDDMHNYNYFQKTVYDMKKQHFQKVMDRNPDGAEMELLLNPVFTEDEKAYLKRKKWFFILTILGKTLIIISIGFAALT
ncbi:MAG: hypothetical protein LBH47_00875 [Christensenellaceae bacterium]|nr:hypothetical protein [Christensenellaceae bacterium]